MNRGSFADSAYASNKFLDSLGTPGAFELLVSYASRWTFDWKFAIDWPGKVFSLVFDWIDCALIPNLRFSNLLI